jgi:hypothetical protein
MWRQVIVQTEVFWSVTPDSLVSWCWYLNTCAASIFRVEVCRFKQATGKMVMRSKGGIRKGAWFGPRKSWTGNTTQGHFSYFSYLSFFPLTWIKPMCLSIISWPYSLQYVQITVSVPEPTQFNPGCGGSMFLHNVGVCFQDHMVSQPRRPQSEHSSLWKS